MYIIHSNVHVNQPTVCLMLLLLIDVDKAIQNMHKSNKINNTNCVIDKYLFFPYSIISSYHPVLKSVFSQLELLNHWNTLINMLCDK